MNNSGKNGAKDNVTESNKISFNSITEKNKYDDDYDYLIKIILVGESLVGKSNICKRYCFNEFDPNSKSTVSFELIEKFVFFDNQKIKACIWDTLGQERYSSISNQYYKATNGALFIFDISNRESFEKINKWVENYNNYGEKDNIVKFLVGNKSDLNNSKVTKEEIYIKTKAYEFDEYFETSALDGKNINIMFEKMTKCKYFNFY